MAGTHMRLKAGIAEVLLRVEAEKCYKVERIDNPDESVLPEFWLIDENDRKIARVIESNLEECSDEEDGTS
jgi:hypothetical protein